MYSKKWVKFAELKLVKITNLIIVCMVYKYAFEPWNNQRINENEMRMREYKKR